MRLLGAVLAGGRASRFGSDKALAEWRGRPLLVWAIEALARDCDAVIVCGRSAAPVETVPDRPAPGLGPLGGLNAALHHAAALRFDAVLSAPCDAPSLPLDLADRLRSAGPAAFVATLPLIGLWPATSAGTLDAFVATDGRRSVRAFAERIGATPIALPRTPANINSPADLAALDAAGAGATDFPESSGR